MKKKLRRALGMLLCAVMLVSALPAAAAGQEGKQLYSWTASTLAQDEQLLACNLVNNANAKIRWNDTGVIYAQQGSVQVKGHTFLNEAAGSGNKTYGLPSAADNLKVDLYPSISSAGAGAVALSFIYAYNPAEGGLNAATSDKMIIRVSENGVDWSEDSVGIRSAQLLGGGTLGKEDSMFFYRVWSEDLMEIDSLTTGDLIYGVSIQPNGEEGGSKGSFTLCELQLVSFSGKGAYTAAVPVQTEQQGSGVKVDVDAIRAQLLETARQSQADTDMGVIVDVVSQIASVEINTAADLLDTAGISLIEPMTTKANDRVRELFEYMYARDLLTKEQGDAMLKEYETYSGTKYILWDLNRPQHVMRAYAAAKPADILLQVTGDNGHAYVIVKSEPVYLADDFTIDPNQSKLTYLTEDGEQTYTYSDMYTKYFFVPVAVDALTDGTLGNAQADVVVSVADGVHVSVLASLNIMKLEVSVADTTVTADKPGSTGLVYSDKKLDAAVAALADGKHQMTVKVYCGPGDPVTKVIELEVKGGKATVLAAAAPSHAEICPAKAMTDVDKNAWYHEAVDYALTNSLMGGYNATTFGPNDTLSRAMVVQVLYNKEGQPTISGKHNFTDVPADQWFNNAITWGTQKGVMGGYGDGKFGPNDNVTLEQLAVILWNYSGNPSFTGTADSVGTHSGWAANGLAWALENGILANVPYENVTAGATRAQTAQMLMNYLTAN